MLKKTFKEKISKLKIEHILYFIICSILVVSCFVSPIYSWDLDHEIYFGSRLLHGELIWTQEFHDKLPFVPFLFVIPAYFKSIFVFKFLSLLSILGVFFSFIFLIPKIFKSNNLNDKALFCYIVYFSILYFSYDSIATINCISVSLYFIAFLLIIYERKTNNEHSRIACKIIGSLLAAAVISIRPYFLPAFGVVVFYASFIENSKKILFSRKVYHFFVWIFLIGVFGVVLNVIPYVLTQQMSAFWDGLSLLRDHINPLSASHDFFKRMRKFPDIILWGSWFLMFFCFVGSNKEKEAQKNVAKELFFVAFLSNLFMIFYMLSEHYWRHYIQLFVANYCLCLFSVLLVLAPNNYFSISCMGKKKIKIERIFSIISLFFIFFLCFELKKEIHLAKTMKFLDAGDSYSTTNNWKEKLFSDYLEKENKKNKISFLFPDDMKAHWILEEGRHSFPHSANTKHIFLGWWKNITFKSSHFLIATSSEQYCRLIASKGADLIIVQPNSFVIPCLVDPHNGYVLQVVLENSIGKEFVFKRITRP